MKYIETFREGMHTTDVYLCKNKQIALTKSGKEYGNLVLQDKTGTIDAKIWDLNSPGVGDFETMDYVHVEADVSNGLPVFHMVGYLASEVKEAGERVRTAIKNSGFDFPAKRTVINLSPATMRKRLKSNMEPVLRK